MKPLTIQRFQLALFILPKDLARIGLSLEQAAQFIYMRHVWATDNLYRLPRSEGARVTIWGGRN